MPGNTDEYRGYCTAGNILRRGFTRRNVLHREKLASGLSVIGEGMLIFRWAGCLVSSVRNGLVSWLQIHDFPAEIPGNEWPASGKEKITGRAVKSPVPGQFQNGTGRAFGFRIKSLKIYAPGLLRCTMSSSF
jgi:hypothetical protein